MKDNENSFENIENPFKEIWDNTLDGMRLIDETGRVLLVNDAFCKMIGKTKESLEGEACSIIYDMRYRENMFIKICERFRTGNIESHFERKLPLWNGKRVWFELSNSFIKMGKGKTLLLSIFRDITKRKSIENRLRESEGKFRGFVEKSINGILMVDEQGIILEWNYKLEQLTGVFKREVMGKFLWNVQLELSPGKYHRLLTYEEFRDILDRGRAAPEGEPVFHWNEITFQNLDGNRKVILTRFFPLKLQESLILGGTISDVTERVSTEEKICESENLITGLLNSLLHTAVIADKTGNILFYGNAFSSFLNKPEEDLTKFNYFKLLPEETAVHRKMFFDKLIESGTPLFFEDVCFDKTWENNYSMIPGHGSKCPPKIILFSRDITDLHLSGKAFKETIEETTE